MPMKLPYESKYTLAPFSRANHKLGKLMSIAASYFLSLFSSVQVFLEWKYKGIS